MRSYPSGTREQVVSLRKTCLTYREIREKLRLNIPKGTMSYWVRNIKMTPDFYKRINSLVKNNIWKAQAVNKQKLTKRLKLLRSRNISLIKEINLPLAN